uniref:Oligopeptide transporter OPT family n=1 Tax=Solanum tuberosum TaxID=4113 RepID=M0ZW50_SOLTU
MYVVTPLMYWFNVYKAKNLPIFSDGMFKENSQDYNISNIIDPNFHIDLEKYDHEDRLYLSIVLLLTYGFSFATVVHVFLFHGRDLWHLSKSSTQEKKMDVQTKLMRKLLFPIPGLNVITEYIMGYLYPVANMFFKVYGYISMKQGLTFLKDLKLGHYMKIPPRAMFMAQVVGTLISAFAHLGIAWWLMNSASNICDRALLPQESPWTCPADHVFYDASVVWV